MNELLNLIVVIIIAGVVLWLINALIPMAPIIKSLLNLLVAIVIVLYILQFFGLIPTVIPIVQLIR